MAMSVISLGNSIQAYISLAGSREVYAGKPNRSKGSQVTGLSARTFGTWTALSSVVRLYGAYNINEPLIYQLCLWTYGIAFHLIEHCDCRRECRLSWRIYV